MAIRTSTTPSQWAEELERDPQAFWTAVHLLEEQDRERDKRQD